MDTIKLNMLTENKWAVLKNRDIIR